MPSSDPTGDGCAVAITVKTRHSRFLREMFETAREGLLGDLAEHGDRLRDPERLRREAAAFGRLLAGLRASAIVPDPELRAMLAEQARLSDEDNEYERVVFEHEAFRELLAQLAPAGTEGC